MLLVDPATYLSVDAFKAEPNDQDLTSYSDDALEDILVRASGKADAIMRRTYLPTEVTEQYEGNGTNELFFGIRPVIYLKSLQLVMPGFAPFALPIGQLMIDYNRGSIRSWSPMIWQSLGISGSFPRDSMPILANFAYGCGYAIAPPNFTLATTPSGTMAAGEYDFQVTSRTQSGESLPATLQSVTLNAQGGINVVITPQPGALLYRVYAAAHGVTPQLVAESQATNFGEATLTVAVTSLAPPAIGALPLPTTDTSAWPVPNAIIEAVRLLALSIIWEQNNKANRGLYQQRSDGRMIAWRSTEGTSGRGKPLAVEEATNMLQPFSFVGVF